MVGEAVPDSLFRPLEPGGRCPAVLEIWRHKPAFLQRALYPVTRKVFGRRDSIGHPEKPIVEVQEPTVKVSSNASLEAHLSPILINFHLRQTRKAGTNEVIFEKEVWLEKVRKAEMREISAPGFEALPFRARRRKAEGSLLQQHLRATAVLLLLASTAKLLIIVCRSPN